MTNCLCEMEEKNVRRIFVQMRHSFIVCHWWRREASRSSNLRSSKQLIFFFTIFKEVKMKNSLGTGGSLFKIQISEWKKNRHQTNSVVDFNWVYCCSSFHRQGSAAALAGERDAGFRQSLRAHSASDSATSPSVWHASHLQSTPLACEKGSSPSHGLHCLVWLNASQQ